MYHVLKDASLALSLCVTPVSLNLSSIMELVFRNALGTSIPSKELMALGFANGRILFVSKAIALLVLVRNVDC